MPRSCCVPGCNSNYYKGEYVPVFSFPSDEEKRKNWIRKIPRENLVVTKNTGVCILHFPEEKIVREIRATRPDGSVISLPRKKLELEGDAVPCKFPNLPSYLSSSDVSHRTDPEERKKLHEKREMQKYTDWLSEDYFTTLDEITTNLEKFEHNDWLIKKHSDKLHFIELQFNEFPCVKKVLTLDNNFKTFIICDNISIEPSRFSWILGAELTCNSYAKLENLLTAIKNIDSKEISIKETVCRIQALLVDCLEKSEDDETTLGLKFLSEQLQLLISKQLRYSSDLLLTACSFFFSYPAAYKFVRQLKIIVLPHPQYLKTFNLSSINSGINEPLKKYLKTKHEALELHENMVCLLLDEIFVKPKITYKGNRLVGMASNSVDMIAASTVQTFMIKSILSKNKDVVALVPVKNLDAEFLHVTTVNILRELHEIGFHVVCVIADNNKVNVKLYKTLSGDTKIHAYVPHPCNSNKKVFLLFDTVHLLKNLRNNWLNEKNSTFIFPSMSDVHVIQQCSFRHIRQIYEEQKLALVKHAPGLSYKVCYPNSLERQNVSYVVPLFDEKTIVAVSTLVGVDGDGTKQWLEIIRNWWMTVNVKHPKKGVHLREKYAHPISSMDQENIKYLKSFCSWLQNWNDMIVIDSPKAYGKLSRETFGALLHTTQTLVKLCEYLLNDLKLHYVMLGTFQTDDLEQRFGKYRRMSGCNYNVSVQQIIESERKLKVTSLLSLQSKQVKSLNVTDIIQDINASSSQIVEGDSFLSLETDDIISEAVEMNIGSGDLEVIIFIAGYVSFKVCSRLRCVTCKSLLMTESDLVWQLPVEVSYLKSLTRGGLKYPSEISVEIGICIYHIFEVLISDKYEIVFINCENPKGFLKSLILDMLELQYSRIDCECGKSVIEIFDYGINIWVNVLLNNYSKIKTNNCVEEKARKTTKRTQTDIAAKMSRKTLFM